EWARASMASVVDNLYIRLSANPWRPPWLVDASADGPEDALYERAPRRADPIFPGDPILMLAELEHYQSQAQRQAVRTVLCAPPGSTVIVNLPTGSGKTLCGLLLALLLPSDGSGQLGVTPIVVPTVSLALDLEMRSAEIVGHATAYRSESESANELRLR